MFGILPALLMASVMAQTPPDYAAEGLKALDANQPAVAEGLFRKAVEADATDLNAHFNLSLALSLESKDAEAMAELRKVLELKPGLYEAELNLGILLLRNRRAAEAGAVLKEAVDAKPKEARPRLFYAQALLEAEMRGRRRGFMGNCWRRSRNWWPRPQGWRGRS